MGRTVPECGNPRDVLEPSNSQRSRTNGKVVKHKHTSEVANSKLSGNSLISLYEDLKPVEAHELDENAAKHWPSNNMNEVYYASALV
jgi:hypothetical protein